MSVLTGKNTLSKNLSEQQSNVILANLEHRLLCAAMKIGIAYDRIRACSKEQSLGKNETSKVPKAWFLSFHRKNAD